MRRYLVLKRRYPTPLLVLKPDTHDFIMVLSSEQHTEPAPTPARKSFGFPSSAMEGRFSLHTILLLLVPFLSLCAGYTVGLAAPCVVCGVSMESSKSDGIPQ